LGGWEEWMERAAAEAEASVHFTQGTKKVIRPAVFNRNHLESAA
jgi:hypothetical protein